MIKYGYVYLYFSFITTKYSVSIDFKGKSRKELCSNFTHPKNWEYVLNDPHFRKYLKVDKK